MTGPLNTDELAIRRAARIVTAQITVASCLLVLAIVAVAVLAVIEQSQPGELLEPALPGEHKIYVDSNKILLALALTAVIAILFAAAASWVIARRAVGPLGDALRIQRTFVADASHELRTPLAVMDARLQLLQLRTPADSPTATVVDELRTDSRTLIDIVNDLLLAAGGDPPDPAAPPTDAVASAATAVNSLRLLADTRDITLTLDHDPMVLVRMPETSFRRCVTALVDNAINHSEDHGQVLVQLVNDDRRVLLRVIDHGSGIRGIEPHQVFDRFAHSAEPAWTGRRTSFGIGLALVRDLAVRGGGNVRVADTSDRGTTLVLELPAAT